MSALLVAIAILGTTMVPETSAGKKKARRGVFGTVNGKNFVATNLEGASDRA